MFYIKELEEETAPTGSLPGLRWGSGVVNRALRTGRSEVGQHVQQVLDVDDAVIVGVAGTGSRAVIATAVFTEPVATHGRALITAE